MRFFTGLVDHSMSSTLTKFFASVKGGVEFSAVEATFLALFLWGSLTGDNTISPFILWASFVCCAVWVAITSSPGAVADAKGFVLRWEIYMSDFLVSAVLLLLCALVALPYPWYFSTMLLIAMCNNLRYAYFSLRWLLESRNVSP